MSKRKPLYCNYAWGHLDFHARGQFTPCFRFDTVEQPMKSLADSLPSDYINCKEIRKVRKSLAKGKWPAGCRECKNKEQKRLHSYRKESIDPNNKNWHGTPFDYSKTTIEQFHEVEMKFSRTCNFYCRHCDSQSNSRFELLGKKNPEIRDELNKLDYTHLSPPKNPIADVTPEIIDDLVKNIIPKTKRIMFGGGEPLFQIEHYKFLERLINDPNIDTKNLTLDYNTNLSMINFKKYSLEELWNHFGSIHVTISLDGTRKLFNYFRQNGDYNETIEHINSIAKNVKTLDHISFVCTSTAYHAFYMDQILEDFANLRNQLTSNYSISVSFKPTFVHHPEILDMVNLPNNVKKHLIKKYDNFVPNISGHESLENYQRCMKEVITYLKNPCDIEVDFKKVAKLQDKLHNVDAFEFAPRIAEYVYNDKLI